MEKGNWKDGERTHRAKKESYSHFQSTGRKREMDIEEGGEWEWRYPIDTIHIAGTREGSDLPLNKKSYGESKKALFALGTQPDRLQKTKGNLDANEKKIICKLRR